MEDLPSLCDCMPEMSVFDRGVCDFKKPSTDLSGDFPKFLNTDLKWGTVVVGCYCMHRVLWVMEEIFRLNLSAWSCTTLVGDLCLDIITYNPCVDVTCYNDIVQGYVDDPLLDDYDVDGNVYLFFEPFSSLYDMEKPDFTSSSRKWTSLIENVCTIDDYRWVVEELVSDSELEKWFVQGVLKKFNGDLVFYNNMKKNEIVC